MSINSQTVIHSLIEFFLFLNSLLFYSSEVPSSEIHISQSRDPHAALATFLLFFSFSFPPSQKLTLRHLSNSPSLPRYFFSRKKKTRKQHTHRETQPLVQFNDPPQEMVDGVEFAGTICSICYEPLNPVSEDLQSVSICGHVFHELCLQQWFEYCSRGKKHTCPVCKQSCRTSDACRLYFQSVGDANDGAKTQKSVELEEDAGVLRREVKRLEVKVSGLSSELERQGKELEGLNEELCACKEQAKIETALKNEALNQKASIQFQLHMKSEELEKSTLECFRLKDRNMALAKELAALKLVSDLDIDEEEVLKLATLGNGANSKDTIDTLKRSLVMRNRSYKELMAKCNILGRGEARYSKKLEKAKEKITKLKARVQELETLAEAKENEYLMSLKLSKKTKSSKNVENSINSDSDALTACKFSLKEQSKQISTPKSGMDLTANNNSESVQSLKIENPNATKNKTLNISNGSKTTLSLDNKRDYISIDEDDSEGTKALQGCSKHNYKDQDRDAIAFSKPSLVKPEAVSGIRTETFLQGKCTLAESPRVDIDIDMVNISAGAMDEDLTLKANVKQPMVNIRKESPLALSNSAPGNICFSGGLLGPDGTHRYLGKWCKRGQNSESSSAKRSSNGDLIAVGADGRGGRIKVLRTPSQILSGDKENSVSSKRSKFGAKTSSLQSQGCLQIEHFFGKVTQ
ncbi:girdin protein [Spatholobus suberectus]|nr:girdin protein [Spatholobus suberectus]